MINNWICFLFALMKNLLIVVMGKMGGDQEDKIIPPCTNVEATMMELSPFFTLFFIKLLNCYLFFLNTEAFCIIINILLYNQHDRLLKH